MPLPRTPLRRLAIALPALLIAPLALVSPAGAVPGAGSPVWINEIHYDNVGADTGEAIEIAAPAGSDLTGWTVALYNGSPSVRAVYDTKAVPGGAVADSGNGWGFVTLTYPSNGIQNGAPDGVALVDASGGLVQFLSYEGSFVAAGGPANGQTSTDIGVAEQADTPVGASLQLTGGGAGGNDPGDFSWTASDDDSFGAANAGQAFGAAPDPIQPPPPPPCESANLTLISTVQGSGWSTPIPGETVTVEGVLSADRVAGLGGFWVEEETADRDTDPKSSEGVFVFGDLPTGAVEGDVIQVTGGVSERYGQTQISASAVQDCGGTADLPAPAEVTFPLPSSGYLERFEGMVVTFPEDLVLSEYYNFDRFGETVVGAPPNGWDRFHTPTAVVEPGDPARELLAEYRLRQITLDDGRGSSNPTPAYFPGTVDTPFTEESSFRGGDTLTDVTGVLGYSFSRYRVHPTADATYSERNPRPESPPAVGGDIQVASFNVLNYFLTLDQGENICGANQDMGCRGADTPEEFQRQKTKIVQAIARMDAEIVGLIEMENTPGVDPGADLAAALNRQLGARTYASIDTGVVGTDAIRLGFLYQPAKVQPLGGVDVLDSSVDPRFVDTKSRPALAQTFKVRGGDHRFTVAVNHLKSKGSDCNELGDPNTGDGQANCNRTRTAAAEALADWLNEPYIGKGDPDRLIIGDLNSYDHEDPIDALRAAGYTDLIKRFGGEYAYGYVFDGMVGYLDHALANASMESQVTGAAEWHINADEPDILDYDMTYKKDREDALWSPDPFRSSDHDAVLVGLNVTGNNRS